MRWAAGLRMAGVVVLSAALSVAGGAASAGSAQSGTSRGSGAAPDQIRAGHARIEVLSPTLIRLEYSSDDRFENRPTMVAQDRSPIPGYTTTRRRGVLTVRTSALVLRYRVSAGAFTAKSLTVRPVGGGWTGHPRWRPTTDRRNLGGWTRALDNDTGPVALHPGLLSRSGWSLLNDTHDALLTSSAPGFAARPATSRYQDGYFFGYGRDFRLALADLRRLSGPAPLLPRSAFGVWFSRYFPYRASDYHRLLRQFRSHRVPLDTLSIDTDWKRQPSPLSAVLAGSVVGSRRAYSWNGWEWNRTLFPHPHQTLAWLHRQGVEVALNIHPSIDSSDPQYAATIAKTGPLPTDLSCTVEQVDPAGTCHVFDLTQARQLAAYFALHAPIKADGVDEWWLDWCCDATTASAPGLTPDTWLNLQYTKHIDVLGDRWLVLSRVGGSHQGGDTRSGPGPGIYAEHRYAIHFTGDTCATWQMLAFEARLTAEEGNVGLPYVSHDIGSFNGAPHHGQCSPTAAASGAKDPPQLYARWVQFGALQPILRLHSNHGNRLPWQYPKPADRAATRALRLRVSLVPYLYTVARTAYDTGLPITRSLYLQWPRLQAAYHHPSEYTLGTDVLVRPVTAAGNPALATVWFPPGRWVDYFTGTTYAGPSTRRLSVPLDQMPVFVRAGGVLPTESALIPTSLSEPAQLALSVYPGADGSFRLYDDHGTGFGYRHRAEVWTRLVHRVIGRETTLRIAAARGHFAGMRRTRSWTVRFVGVARPTAATVNGDPVAWRYDPHRRIATVQTGRLTTRQPVEVRMTASSASGSRAT